jgi:hypothetical protein
MEPAEQQYVSKPRISLAEQIASQLHDLEVAGEEERVLDDVYAAEEAKHDPSNPGGTMARRIIAKMKAKAAGYDI